MKEKIQREEAAIICGGGVEGPVRIIGIAMIVVLLVIAMLSNSVTRPMDDKSHNVSDGKQHHKMGY